MTGQNANKPGRIDLIPSGPVPLAVRERAIEVMRRNGLRPQDLRNQNGPSPLTVSKFLEGEGNGPKPSTYGKIARSLGLSLKELLTGEETAVGSPLRRDFLSVHQLCCEVDRALMRSIRGLDPATPQLEEIYLDVATGQASRLGLDLGAFLAELAEEPTRGLLADTLPRPLLRVAVEGAIKEIRFKFGSESILLENPELLWDCTCMQSPPDSECPVHSVDRRIAGLFEEAAVGIQAAGVTTHWRSLRYLWPPSIDSFLLVETAKEYLGARAPLESILDLGSGTGFLGIALAAASPAIQSVTLSDWLATPYLYGLVNAKRSLPASVSVTPRLGLGSTCLPRSQEPQVHDLLICNPPYLPLLGDSADLSMHATIAGTQLLEYVIAQGPDLAKTTILQFSDMALPEANAAASRSGRTLAKIGPHRSVPFRVPQVFQRPEYLQSLVESGRISRSTESRHTYSHKLQAYLVQ